MSDDQAAPVLPPISPQLAQAYSVAERKFDSLVKDVHLSFLEVALYHKYFIEQKTEERLRCLNEVVQALHSHRLATLKLLKLIHEREEYVAQLLKKAESFAAGKLTTLEVQTIALQLLHAHQSVTLQIVEGILAWREPLTRPYAFQWKDHNYITKILQDCVFIDKCQLRTILPLRVSQFPLCSNISSLSLFSTNDASKSFKPNPHASSTSPERTTRLRAAEKIMFAEQQLQERVLKELKAISDSGCFVPLLNLPHVVPKCNTGVSISRQHWTNQLRQAVDGALQATAALVVVAAAPDAGGHNDDGVAAAENVANSGTAQSTPRQRRDAAASGTQSARTDRSTTPPASDRSPR